jgi:two-component system response regulator AtoC
MTTLSGHVSSLARFPRKPIRADAMAATITLQSLLETHDQPFAIIDSSLTIVAVNGAYERCFSLDRKQFVGQPCCRITGQETSRQHCRHRQLFQDLEPYRLTHSDQDANGNPRAYHVCGYPLVDGDDVIYLGESIVPIATGQGPARTKMVGESPAFRRFAEQLERIAATHVPVLLEGETGTGKEVAAEYLHAHSRRRDQQLVVVDCTVLGEDLFESELFGHEKGAFTGAAGSKKGLFELADQGTLFLDEIGELPLSQQPKLLRALESGSFRRVGSADIRRADVRIVGATNRNLLEMVRRGEFREDLYYRIAVFPLRVPCLRERREDIPQIAQFLLSQIGGFMGRQFRLTPRAVARLLDHSFPGNVRELRNVMQLAATLAPGDQIDAEHILLRSAINVMPAAAASVGDSVHNPLEDMEIAYISDLLKKHEGSRKAAAAEMNISERTLYRKLKRYHIHS